jgi:DNA-binding MarR family transcriptional regulator
MSEKLSRGGAHLLALAGEVLRLQQELDAVGEGLAAEAGLSRAQAQLLTALAYAKSTPTAAALGRRLGLSRQAVQRVANDLLAMGHIARGDNPEDRRAPRLSLTDKGREAHARCSAAQLDWANRTAEGMEAGALASGAMLLAGLRGKLSDENREK